MEGTRVHPMATNTMERNPHKKLRKFPHVFSKVLELPFGSNTDVAIEEGPNFLCFVAEIEAADNMIVRDVRAYAVEIHPGVIKIVIRNDKKFHGGGNVELSLDKLEIDTWRFRLPASTQPELATAAFMNGKLIVTVPKGSSRGGLWRGEKFGVVEVCEYEFLRRAIACQEYGIDIHFKS